MTSSPNRETDGKCLSVKLHKITDASPKAIRRYEELGLLERVARQGLVRIYGGSPLSPLHSSKLTAQ